jgi:predicted nucleotide-binding protein
MAKQVSNKNITQNQKISTLLIISKNKLVEKLDERILIGIELFNRAINTDAEFSKSKQEYSDWNDYNSEFLKQSFNVSNNEYKVDYDNSGKFIGLYDQDHSPAKKLQNFKQRIVGKVDILKKLKAKSELLKSNYIEETIDFKKNDVTMINKKEVFIVHGHDEAAKTKTARFIEKLGLKPIILHEQASGSRTVIEKIEAYSNVGFGIVLYTACDLGAKAEDNPNFKSRARQNVVFEHGFLIGKIGRENVCALIKDEIEIPNDISGLVYVKMDSEDAWHFKIAKELKNSGYNVDLNDL